MPIKQISKRNISSEVFEQIKSNIMLGEWKPGDKIPSENELSSLFGVSRNSVRAALQKLLALGVLTIRQGEGTFVSNLSPGLYMNALIPMLMIGDDDLIEILEFRKIIEIESVKLAAKRAEPRDIEELEELTRNLGKGKYDPETFAAEDLHFHETLAKCAKNSILLKVYSLLKDLLFSNQVEIQNLIGPSLAFKYHPMILEAVKNRDFQTAAKIMEEHIGMTIEKVIHRGTL